MMRVPGLCFRVPGTRNSGKHCECWIVPGVPGVPGSCARVRACRHRISDENIYLSRARIHTRNTRNTRNNVVVMRVSAVPGTRNTETQTRNTKMTSKKPMREAMPGVAAFIDDMREAFGSEEIDAAIRAGIQGQPTFWARENGIEIGTRSAQDDESGIRVCDTIIGSFRATARDSANGRGK